MRISQLAAVISCLYIAGAAYSPCTIGDGGSGEVSDFQGAASFVVTSGVQQMSAYKSVPTDQCKFEVLVYTDVDSYGDVFVDYLEVYFGVHKKNSAKFERNIRLSYTDGIAEIGGRGYREHPDIVDGCYHASVNAANPEFWTFCLTLPEPGVFHVGGAKLGGATPSDNCWFWVVYEEANTAANSQSHARVWLDTSQYYQGLTVGSCGMF